MAVAENELLDVASAKRWGETRSDLRAEAAPATVAQHAVEELIRSLRSTLALAGRKGQTLESLLSVAALGNEARRAALFCFNDHTLARMVMTAAQKLPGCADRALLVRTVSAMIADRVRDAIVRHSMETSRYQAPSEREALSRELASRLELARQQIGSVIDASLQGLRVKTAPRPRATQASKKLRVKTVLEQSLLPSVVSQIHAQRRR
jgi:hypothetical protein